MANEVILKNWITVSGGWDILNGLIGDIFDQDNISAEYDQSVMTKLWMK